MTVGEPCFSEMCVCVHACLHVCQCVSGVFVEIKGEVLHLTGFFRKLLSHMPGLEPRPGDRDVVWLPEPFTTPVGAIEAKLCGKVSVF